MMMQTTLVALSREASPRECCGLLSIEPGLSISPLFNIHTDPERQFCFDWTQFFQTLNRYHAEGLTPIAWHSHPRTRAQPSLEDIALMQRIRLPMVIISLRATIPLIRIFTAEEFRPKFTEVASYRVGAPELPLVNS